jgi:hypothetical protein
LGALPAAASTVALPATDRVRYDLLRGGIAGARLETSPEMPVLLLERPTKITKLEMTSGLEVRLTDEAGAPVDRSVVRLEVYDPEGTLIRHYSRNYTVSNGIAKMEVPFALNDAKGTWRLRVRDVISGMSAERVLSR